jgi:hypothetical protein
LKQSVRNIARILPVFKPGCLVLLLLMASPQTISSQAVPEEYQVKAVFLYNFSRFIDWPESSFPTPNSPFVIGILGEDPFGNYLEETVRGEAVGTHVMTIHHFQNISDIENCHILFISYKDPDKIRKALDALAGKNILTVNENTNFAKMGGMIQFYDELSKIKLMINESAIKDTQIQISSKLMKVARIY